VVVEAGNALNLVKMEGNCQGGGNVWGIRPGEMSWENVRIRSMDDSNYKRNHHVYASPHFLKWKWTVF